MTKHEVFLEKYSRWEDRVQKQFSQKYPDIGGHIEICEDGSVYLGNLMWFPANTVEPYEDR